MKIRADRAALSEALGWVARAIPKNPQHPVLAGVRVAAEGGVVKVSAFDFDTSQVAAVEATVGDAGECVVPGLFLRDAIAGGRGAEVDLILDDSGLEVTSGRSTFRARCLAIADAPDLPPFPEVRGVVDADRLRDALAMIGPAVSDDTSFQESRGVHIEGTREHLTLVATDRFRIHAVELDWNGDGEFEVTVPGRVLDTAAKGMSETVEVGVSENALGLSDGRHQWTTRRFATPYINWRKAIEIYAARCQHRLTVDRDDLLAAVRQIGAMTQNERPALVGYSDGELSVQTPQQEQGDADEVLAAEGSHDFLLAVNHRFFADALAVTSGPIELVHGDDYTAKSSGFFIADRVHPELTLIVMSKSLLPGDAR